MVNFLSIALLALAATATQGVVIRRAAPPEVQNANGLAAQQLNQKFSGLSANSNCQDGEQACVNGGFAQCVGNKFQVSACAGGTKCLALPLVNKAGTSIACTTDSDANLRFQAVGLNGPLPGGAAKNPAAPAPKPAPKPAKGVAKAPKPDACKGN